MGMKRKPVRETFEAEISRTDAFVRPVLTCGGRTPILLWHQDWAHGDRVRVTVELLPKRKEVKHGK